MDKAFDTPIFAKIYKFYKKVYILRLKIPKQDRYALWQKVEVATLEILENILSTTILKGKEKQELLTKTSNKLNVLRILIRLAKDTKAIANKNYLNLQEELDEVGRMLGGWIKSTRTN